MKIDSILDQLKTLPTPAKPTDVVLMGGAAMFIHGLRESLNDIDLFSPEKMASKDGIDITDNDYMWGTVRIGDALKAPVVSNIHNMRVHVLDPETLFIQKVSAAREKDIDDLALLAGITDPFKVARRVGELKAYNNSGDHYAIAEQVVSELSLQFMDQYSEENICTWINDMNLDASDARDLAAASGVEDFKPKKTLTARIS